MNTADARVVMTRDAIKRSFFELLKQKPVGRITVSEICQMSGINRSTFYKHYRDPLDVLEKLEDEMLKEIEAQTAAEQMGSMDEYLTEVLQKMKLGGSVFRILASQNADPGFSEKIFAVCYRNVFPSFEKRFSQLTDEQRERLYLYLSSGSGGILRQWMYSGMEGSEREVAELLRDINTAAVSPFSVKEKPEPDESLISYINMLKDCHSIWFWCFDREWKIVFQNSFQPNFHSMLLLSQGRQEAVTKHFACNNVPLILNDGLGFMWAAICSADKSRYYIIGPIISGTVSGQQVEKMLAPLNLSVKKKIDILNNLKFVPNVSTVAFFQHIIALQYYVRGEKCRISDFAYLSANTEVPKQLIGLGEKPDEMPHSPKINEQQLFDMIRTGNLEYHNALTTAAAGSPGIRAKNNDPLMQAKYSVVAFTALCSRAAMEGGLSSDVAYTLCDTYTSSIDACTSVSQVASVSHTMYDDFVRRVNKCRRESGVSRPVRICCDYIDIHPTAELSLEELARLSSYSPYYLSRKFKQETGTSISAYIKRVRIEYAKQLLKETDMKSSEIGELLHFCSESYFAEAFRRQTGQAPNEFRLNNLNTA